MSYLDKYVDVSVLTGQTITDINDTGDGVLFTTQEGNRYRMYHQDD